MSDATNLPGPLGAYAAAFKANDIERMRQIVLEVVAADEIVLPHPETGVMCHCRSSDRLDMSNRLFFSDGSDGNHWCLIQKWNFFDFAVTETSIIPISSKPDFSDERPISQLRAGDCDHYWDMRHDYGGLIVSSPRPYHYFYDQLLHLPDIVDNMPENKRIVHIDDTAFLSPKSVWNMPAEDTKINKYYLSPIILGGGQLRAKKRSEFFRLADRMEKAIASMITGRTPDPRADLVLWIGITGQKRSWVEQVEGYAQIVRHLSSSFSDILIYTDGFTAPQGNKIKKDADTQVVKELEAKIGGKARVISLIGDDYPTKIERCQGVDIFIANGGTGCFVPLRVCRKPGLLHSNKNLWTFRGDDYPDTVVFTPPDIVHRVASIEENRAAHVSYSIAWQEIYNRLLPVLFKVKGVQLRPVPLPSAEQTSREFDRNLFRQLSHTLGPDSGAVEVLREVAVLFEKKGDIATAFAVMEQAHLQRPNGPFINRKLQEYRAALATS